MRVPISKIGELQKIDIEADRDKGGVVCYDNYARVCTVFTGTRRDIGDRSPFRMAEMFGGSWQDYNHHFVIQLAGCPLDCPYCYVDNLGEDTHFSEISLVELYKTIRFEALTKFKAHVKVLHVMGGAPAVYCEFWPKLRMELDALGPYGEDVIIFSNVILVENWVYGVEPWRYMNIENFIVEGCLKGTNRRNFMDNTGHDLFGAAVRELFYYVPYENFYLTLISHDEDDLPVIHQWIEPERVDELKVVGYEATKAKVAVRSGKDAG